MASTPFWEVSILIYFYMYCSVAYSLLSMSSNSTIISSIRLIINPCDLSSAHCGRQGWWSIRLATISSSASRGCYMGCHLRWGLDIDSPVPLLKEQVSLHLLSSSRFCHSRVETEKRLLVSIAGPYSFELSHPELRIGAAVA